MIWIEENEGKRREILNQVSEATGLIAPAIEKDWWVSQCLKALFAMPESPHFIFKGGTSLSKAWGLIERFSEDIDLSVSRQFLGFGGDDVSKNQIKKLRKASCEFVSGQVASGLQAGLEALGIPKDAFQLTVPVSSESDVDPQTIFVTYPTMASRNPYLLSRVKVEMGARAMMEPASLRTIQSLIGAAYPQAKWSDSPFEVCTVAPKRTFLEKVFLLHETLQARPETVGDKLSRHLYDLERLMDTTHGKEALEDLELFAVLAQFRSKFNTIKYVDYAQHRPESLQIVPDALHRKIWELDYRQFRESMVYGKSLNFEALIARMDDLQARFRLQGSLADWEARRTA